MNDQKILDFVTALCKRHGANRVILYGSRARGDNHELSDYDIMVVGIRKKETKLDIREECDNNAPTLKQIDIVFSQDASPKLLQHVKRDGIVLYDRHKT
jgi:predicted nucleotidyltransferase